MSRYTTLGDFVEQMPQAFTPIHAYSGMGGLGSAAETAEMLKEMQPIMSQLGVMGVAFAPIIEGHVKSMGASAVPLIDKMPIPDSFKKSAEFIMVLNPWLGLYPTGDVNGIWPCLDDRPSHILGG